MRFAIVVGLMLLGCKGELNPTYCAMHREDLDCLVEGVEEIEPPAYECMSDAECAGNPKGGACDMARQMCAECVPGGNISACAATNQQCGTDQMCHGCITDNNCASGVCLATQTCADEAAVLYARPDGTGTTCTAQAPCDFEGAVDALTQTRHIIKLNRGTTAEYTDDPITIDAPFGVQILGKDITFRPASDDDDEPAIRTVAANLEILGLTIVDADGPSIECTGGVLALQQVTLTNSGSYGVQATGCNTIIKRSVLSGHPQAALRITSGNHEIRNNIIHGNGNPELTTGVVRIEGATGRMRFNTVARNLSENGGGGRVGGILCTPAPGATFAIAQNIVVDWGGANTGVAGCTLRDNFVRPNFADAGFVSTTDFHLTVASPLDEIRDQNNAALDVDCTDGGSKIDDIDGQLRPINGFCDRGADEFSP